MSVLAEIGFQQGETASDNFGRFYGSDEWAQAAADAARAFRDVLEVDPLDVDVAVRLSLIHI